MAETRTSNETTRAPDPPEMYALKKYLNERKERIRLALEMLNRENVFILNIGPAALQSLGSPSYTQENLEEIARGIEAYALSRVQKQVRVEVRIQSAPAGEELPQVKEPDDPGATLVT